MGLGAIGVNSAKNVCGTIATLTGPRTTAISTRAPASHAVPQREIRTRHDGGRHERRLDPLLEAARVAIDIEAGTKSAADRERVRHPRAPADFLDVSLGVRLKERAVNQLEATSPRTREV